jgi:myo-inositol-1-phosphate synthase
MSVGCVAGSRESYAVVVSKKRQMSKIRLAIVGVGNCASSLLQGLEHYKQAAPGVREKPVGLMHYDLGGYRPADVEVACAFDIDARKVGRPLEEACFAPPNNTVTIWPDLPKFGLNVDMGEIHDGIAAYTMKHPPRQIADDIARDRVEKFIAGELER